MNIFPTNKWKFCFLAIFSHTNLWQCCYLPVTVVEHKFLDESEDDELEDDPMKRRQFTSEATAAPLHHDERQVHERNADYRLIDDHHHDSLLQLSTIHLRQHRMLTGNKDWHTATKDASSGEWGQIPTSSLLHAPLYVSLSCFISNQTFKNFPREHVSHLTLGSPAFGSLSHEHLTTIYHISIYLFHK